MQGLENNRGFSLLSVLVSIGLLGVVSMTFSKILKNSFTSQKKISLNDQKMNIARYISSAVDCQKTIQELPVGFCDLDSTKKFDIYGKNSKLLVDKQGTFMGNWLLKPNCSMNDNEPKINITTALKVKPAKNAKFALDPITKRTIDGTRSQDQLFKVSEIGLCSSQLTADASPNANADKPIGTYQVIECHEEDCGYYNSTNGILINLGPYSTAESSESMALKDSQKYRQNFGDNVLNGTSWIHQEKNKVPGKYKVVCKKSHYSYTCKKINTQTLNSISCPAAMKCANIQYMNP